MKQFIIAFLFFGFPTILIAQINGIVLGNKNNETIPLPYAKIKLVKNQIGIYSDLDGKFELVLPKELPDMLVISADGYHSDSILVDKADRFSGMKIILYSDQLLPEVIAAFRKESKSISKLKVLHVEEIGSGELRKAACCNLSESFETNASVDVNVTDAVSGAKQIQMMGLDGVYTQIQMENIPHLRGLETAFGLNAVPGTWINSIQITKGTGTVVNGYESMAGLVNLEFEKPTEMAPLFVNGYVSRFGRAELNAHGRAILNKKWSTGVFGHGSGVFAKNDGNRDGFLDIPTGTNLAFLNRWAYTGKKMEAQFGVNGYWDEKIGGQLNAAKNFTPGVYGVYLDSKHASAFLKTGFFMKKPYNSLGLIYNGKYQEVNARFGTRVFSGTEKRLYFNSIYQSIIGNTNNVYKVGISGVYSDIQQSLDSLSNNRLEIVPGAYAEYTYTGSRLSAVIGVRADYHNLFGGQFSPRVHAKYALSETFDVRVTGGKGWRVPNYMIDNLSLAATSRTWVAPASIIPEIAWNTGASFVKTFDLFKRKSTLSLDYYYTFFENQLITDRDLQTNEIVFTNLRSNSFSNSLQLEWSFSPSKNFDVRMAYKYLDVNAIYGGREQQKVMTPKDRGFLNVAYRTSNNRWKCDATANLFGKSRLPQNEIAAGVFTTNQFSPAYFMLNAQVTYTYKRWEIYLGSENLTNFMQSDPIIDAQNPFGSYFDATRVWGPIMGTNVYAGFRYELKIKK